MSKSKWQKEQEAELKQFAAEAVVSVWKQLGSTFTDYESRVTGGLILRHEDRGEKADRHPLAYRKGRVVRSWLLQCGGECPLKIGDFDWMRVDEAREIAKRLRSGDGRALMDAWFGDSQYEVEAHNSRDERDLIRGLSLTEIAELIERRKSHLKEIAHDPWYAKDRWSMRRQVKVLETIVKRVRAFAKREGLKIGAEPSQTAVPRRARLRRAA